MGAEYDIGELTRNLNSNHNVIVDEAPIQSGAEETRTHSTAIVRDMDSKINADHHSPADASVAQNN